MVKDGISAGAEWERATPEERARAREALSRVGEQTIGDFVRAKRKELEEKRLSSANRFLRESEKYANNERYDSLSVPTMAYILMAYPDFTGITNPNYIDVAKQSPGIVREDFGKRYSEAMRLVSGR